MRDNLYFICSRLTQGHVVEVNADQLKFIRMAFDEVFLSITEIGPDRYEVELKSFD